MLTTIAAAAHLTFASNPSRAGALSVRRWIETPTEQLNIPAAQLRSAPTCTDGARALNGMPQLTSI